MPNVLPIISISLISICSIVDHSVGQIFDHVGRQRPFSPPQPSLPSAPHKKLREHDEVKYQRHPRENPQSHQLGLGRSIFGRDRSGGVGAHSRGAPENNRIFGSDGHETDDNHGNLFHDGGEKKVDCPRFNIFGSTRGQGSFAGAGISNFNEDLTNYGVARNADDPDEEEDSSLRRKRIAMFDVLNLYSSLGTLCKALGLLAARTWRRMETLLLALLFRGEEANRLSSIIVAWVVVATVVVLTALCVKRCCCDRPLYIELLETDDGDDEDARRPRRRKSTVKRKRRVNAAAAAATSGERPKDPRTGGDGGGGEQRRFSQRLRDKNKKDSERQKRAARWVNLCLEAVYEDDAVRDIFLRKWMEALNRHVAEQQETEALYDLNLNFGEMFSSGLPKLSNFNVTADEGGRMLVTSSLEVSRFSLSLTSSRGCHVVSIESFQSVLFATVAPLDGGRVHVISLSMQSLTPPGQDDSGGIDDDEGDEFGPNHCVCVTSSSSRPEDATDKLVRRLAMDAVWCTQLRIDPQDDLGVQTFDEKSDLCPIPAPLSSYRSRLDVLSVTLVRTSGLHSSSVPYVTLELLSPALSAISAAGIGRQKRETVRPPEMSHTVTDQLQSCTVAMWNQQFQFLISPPSGIMGPDEQLLMQVWDESAGCEDSDERDHGDVRGDEDEDDDEDYFVGSWVFNMEELRQPCDQRHMVALNQEQNEHDKQNQLHNEAFSNKEVVMPETTMTVKFYYAAASWDLQHCVSATSDTLANGRELLLPHSDPLTVHKSFESRRTLTNENEIESTTVATYVPMLGVGIVKGHKRDCSNEASGLDPGSKRVSPIPMRQFSAPETYAENAFAKICVADAALRDLYRSRIQGGMNPTRSTLLIRSFQKFPSHCPRIEVERTAAAGDCGCHSEDKSSDFPDNNTSSPSSGCSKTLTLPGDDSRSKRRHRFMSRVRRKFKKKMKTDEKADKSDNSYDNPSPAQPSAGKNNNNYAKVSSLQRDASQASHVTSDRKSRNRESNDNDEAESGSKYVIVSEDMSSSKVSSDCNVCSSDCSDCSDEIEAELDPGMWSGRLSASWQSIDKVAPSLLLDPSADASSLSEMSTSSVAVTPLPAPKLAAGNKATATVTATSARPEAESNLILETTECGLRRHYLIPRYLQDAAGRKRSNRERTSSSSVACAASLLSKQLKSLKGTKLHLAMEHVFVARNIKSGATCDICSRKIVRRFAMGGKQGYVCRGCDVTCHKGCHARVKDMCTSSEFSQMELLRGSAILT